MIDKGKGNRCRSTDDTELKLAKALIYLKYINLLIYLKLINLLNLINF